MLGILVSDYVVLAVAYNQCNSWECKNEKSIPVDDVVRYKFFTF